MSRVEKALFSVFRVRTVLLMLALAGATAGCSRQGEEEAGNSPGAQDALAFTNASAPSPWTVPSVASAFTGLWPNEHGAGRVPGVETISLTLNPTRPSESADFTDEQVKRLQAIGYLQGSESEDVEDDPVAQPEDAMGGGNLQII